MKRGRGKIIELYKVRTNIDDGNIADSSKSSDLALLFMDYLCHKKLKNYILWLQLFCYKNDVTDIEEARFKNTHYQG